MEVVRHWGGEEEEEAELVGGAENKAERKMCGLVSEFVRCGYHCGLVRYIDGRGGRFEILIRRLLCGGGGAEGGVGIALHCVECRS